jgi:hypothetical protein
MSEHRLMPKRGLLAGCPQVRSAKVQHRLLADQVRLAASGGTRAPHKP